MKKLLALPIVLTAACQSYINTIDESISISEQNKIDIDGLSSGWENAYEFEIVNSECGIPADKSSAKFKLGWEDSNLLLFAQIEDSAPFNNLKSPWDGDSLELFIGDGCGGNNLIQLAISSNANNKQGCITLDFRESNLHGSEIIYEVATRKTTIGYNIEVKFPMQNISSANGFNKPSLQILWNDRIDKNKKNRYIWNYSTATHSTTYAQQQLLFDSKPSLKQTDIKAWIVDDNKLYVKSSDSLKFIDSNGQKIQPDIYDKDSTTSIFNGSIASNRLPIQAESSTGIKTIDLNLVPVKYENTKKPNNFEKDIRAFEAVDRYNMPKSGGLVAVGSSSIRNWFTINHDLNHKNIIRRGFGGSKTDDVLFYLDRIVLPYSPTKIIYYAGENDIYRETPLNKTVSSAKQFIEKVHNKLPDTKIYIVSIKATVQKIKLLDKVKELNREYKALSDKYGFVEYIDVHSKMFDSKGELMKDIFQSDNSHINQKGYQIWSKEINRVINK